MNINPKLDLEILHRSLLRTANYNSDLAWSAISQAYLNLDTSRGVAEQVAFMRMSATGHILDVYTKRRNTAFIPESRLTFDDQHSDSSGYCASKLEIATAATDPMLESDIVDTYLAVTPCELHDSMRVVLDAVFDGYFKRGMTSEHIRKLLQKQRVYGNISAASRQLLKIIRDNF